MENKSWLDVGKLIGLGIEVRLMLDVSGAKQPIPEGYVLANGERAYNYARVPSHFTVYGRERKNEPLEKLEPEDWIGGMAIYRARVLVFDAGDETMILVVGKNKETREVWRSLKRYDLRCDVVEVAQSKPKVSEVYNGASPVVAHDELKRAKTMNGIGSKIKAARDYRALLERSTSGVLLCRKDDIRERFGGEYLKVNVSRNVESLLDCEAILVYPPLHQAKDLVLLVYRESDCYKEQPELFDGHDPYTIAQRVLNRASE